VVRVPRTRRVPRALPARLAQQGIDYRVTARGRIIGRVEAIQVLTACEMAGFDQSEAQPREIISQRRWVVGPGRREDVVVAAGEREIKVTGFVHVDVEGRHSALKCDLPAQPFDRRGGTFTLEQQKLLTRSIGFEPAAVKTGNG